MYSCSESVASPEARPCQCVSHSHRRIDRYSPQSNLDGRCVSFRLVSPEIVRTPQRDNVLVALRDLLEHCNLIPDLFPSLLSGDFAKLSAEEEADHVLATGHERFVDDLACIVFAFPGLGRQRELLDRYTKVRLTCRNVNGLLDDCIGSLPQSLTSMPSASCSASPAEIRGSALTRPVLYYCFRV